MRTIHTPQTVCRFGWGQVDITPPVGMYHRMWGAATHECSTGVHSPLKATALAFRPPEKARIAGEQVIVALDHCLFPGQEMTALRNQICEATGLDPDHLLITFSHTHAAGLLGLDRVGCPGGDRIPRYLEQLAEKVTGIVCRARQSLQSATITYGVGRCSLAVQRDYWDEESGQYVCGFNPQGQADDTVLVARVTGEDGTPLAVLVNYACHPTTLAWQNTLISADFPGSLCHLVEEWTGSQTPCVFLQGASGDLGPREGYVGDPAVAERNGRQLGHVVLATLELLPPPRTRFQYTGPVVSGATLGTWAHVRWTAQEAQAAGVWRRRSWMMELPYREGLPTREQTEAERTRWLAAQAEAERAGDLERARDCHAQVERKTRQLTRLRDLPAGAGFPMPITLWQMGQSFWLGVEGEHYQWLQQALRRRCQRAPLMVMTLANGSRPGYLPTRDTYGKGIYQESIALLAPGCLEQLAEEVGRQLDVWQGSSPDEG